MAWFQHEVGMFDDRKVKKLRRACGFQSYGLWCFILEQIAKEGMLCRLATDYKAEDMSIDTEISVKAVKDILKSMADINLIHKELYEKTGIVFVPQFTKYYDDYHKRKKRDYNRTVSEHSPNPRTQERERDIKRDIKIDANNTVIPLRELCKNDPELTKTLDKILKKG